MAKERLTCGDIFAGGGGWSLGAIAAGLEPIWAIENDPAVAECYAANIGQHVIVEQAQSVDIRRLDAPDVLLASPPCQSHSNARSKRLAARDDAEVGLCVLDYVRILRPRFIFIENVEGWKRSHSFKAIFHGLHTLGYWCDVQVLNAADFGVCQTRRRLILRASREGMLPALPLPVAWRGWHGAIEDLIDGLPESRFADWQIRRLPEGLLSSLLVGGGNTNKDQIDSVARDESQPAFTIASNAGWSTRAFIVRSSDQRENCDIARPQNDPVWTLTEGNTAHSRVKAFIVSNQNDAPSGVADRGPRIFEDSEPVGPILSSQAQRWRAFIVGDQHANDGKSITVRGASEPAPTSDTRDSKKVRAWLDSGRVIAMSPRALARFQSFPDTYILPSDEEMPLVLGSHRGLTGLACRIIGNAMPPLFAQRLLEGLL